MCSPFQSQIGNLGFPISGATDLLHAPILMMTMCARGFILWIINVGLVIYLGAAARKLCERVRWNNYTIFRWQPYHNTFTRRKTTYV